MRPRASLAAALALCGALAGCGRASGSSAGALDVPPPTATGASSPAASPTDSSGVSPEAERVAPLGRPGAWRITTYYTAVESLHNGRLKAVKGCPELHCSHGKAPLGSYPEDFLAVIQEEGSGRITSGPQRGRYLNWSHSVGYWLDDTTRDSAGHPLRPWSSAAADRSVLARGQRFAIVECGRDGNGHRIEAAVCAAFRKARWTVTDLFRPGYGGENHADVYIGEETGPGFAGSPFYTTLSGATLGPS
ncbi:hypothetical protein [Actinomadura montaniterrae]|uniref:Uncharacterized protein n=1 Tax=Actinomadura montaniterrae TaxID=1803903 RepID=A0A6L3VIG5_9ACTN|nr:hypothetical protein [Actinomadura montaniterrae]KAB2370583.1 hypothetical protein F9B16_35125 [Actinomadura montaniterrae]